jgi:hypothetical protein
VLPRILSAPELAYRLLPRVEPGRALADAEWRTLVSAAEVLLEGSPCRMPPARVADNVERFLSEGRSRRAWRCRVLLVLVEWSAWPIHGRPFSELTLAERRRLIEERYVRGSYVYRLCAKIRYLVLMGAYGDQDAARATGYVPVEERNRFRTVPAAKRLVVVREPDLVRVQRIARPKPIEGTPLA